MKRAMDVTLSALGLLLLWPLMGLVAIGIKLTMGSPIIFKQWRPGLHGQLFLMYKFRTMRTGSGSDKERLTQFGHWLRSTSLDELPELWNVLKGDMSLVGPRPLLPQYLDLYDATQLRRHDVRPGMTGLSQVSGRNDSTWNERFDHDLHYVTHRSSAMDIQLIRLTFKQLLSPRHVSAHANSAAAPLGDSTGAQ